MTFPSLVNRFYFVALMSLTFPLSYLSIRKSSQELLFSEFPTPYSQVCDGEFWGFFGCFGLVVLFSFLLSFFFFSFMALQFRNTY